TIAINHLGDYGTQFGMLIAAYKLWGDREAIEKNPIDELLDLYVRYNKLQELDPAARDTARDWFKKLEQGDEEATEIWTWMKQLSIVEFEKVYDMLGIKYDSYKGEAFYSDKMPAVIEEIKEKNIGKMDDGAYIVDLKPYNLTPLIIVKSNGTTTYATRDIAAARYRKKTYDFYKNIYVVASEQNLHFQPWKQVLKLMGDEWADDCIHVNFGLISLKDGALSTRQGRVLKLEDVLNKAIEKTRDIIEKRNPNLENKDEVAKMVGTGAIVFQELFNQRIKDYVFDWDKTLSFEGETGPYAQYTYARCKSLIDKNGGFDPAKVDFDLVKDEAYEILKYVYDLPRTIVMAMEKYEAFYITRNIIDIAKAFNKYYAANQIITDDEKLTNSRLAIVDITQKAIKVGMNLIGVQTPDRM
ncbi:MAG: arginine--tRNA ligase, partial [Fenollaria timonensis]